MKRYCLLFAALILVTTACGSDQAPSKNDPSIVTAPSVGVGAPSMARSATAADYASLIAAQEPPLQKASDALKKCRDVEAAAMCTAELAGYAFAVQVLGIVLNGALDPLGPQYLGSPPAETQKLIATTKAAVSRMANDQTRLQQACGSKGIGCQAALSDWFSDKDAVAASVSAWSPYLR
jgi:hypothetical protein